jgi:hypothetical protein
MTNTGAWRDEWRDADKPESCPESDGLYMIRLSDGTEKAEFYSVIDGWATDEAVKLWLP